MTKKIIALSLALLLLCPMLCSCGLFFDEEGNFVGLNNIIEAIVGKSPTELIIDELLGDIDSVEFEENEPYRLEFESNGNDTCAVTDIKINPDYVLPFEIVIPELSPDGDKVTAIAWGNDRFASASYNVPAILSVNTYNDIINSLSGVLSEFELAKLQSFFILQDLTTVTADKAKDEMLERFPVTEYFPVYAFDTSASPSEATSISRMIALYYKPITQLYTTEYAEMVIEIQEQEGDVGSVDVLRNACLMTVVEGRGITSLVDTVRFPEGVSFVDEGCFENFYCLGNVVLSANASYQLVEQLAKSDIFVCMDTDNANYDWNGLYTAQQDTQEYKILLRSDVDPLANGYSEGELNRFWRYVDGKPTPWDHK